MAKLTDSAIALRVNTALQIMGLLTENPKMKLAEACKQFGWDVKTYRFWIRKSSEALLAFQEVRQETERQELASLLVVREQILEHILKDATSNYTDPISRLAIAQYLDRRLEELSERHRVTDISAVNDLLSGVAQKPGENRFSPGSNELEVATQEDGSVVIRPKKVDVIDAETLDMDPLIR